MFYLALFGLDPEHVKAWMHGGSYGVMFALLFSCGLGLPLPEDVPIITAGVMIAHGQMHWLLAAPLAWLGVVGGDCVLYMLGWRFGYNVTKLPLIGRHVTMKRIQRAEVLFEKYGILVVGIGRMFAGVRGAMVITAGTTRFRFHRFVIADGLGAIVSGGLFMYLGFWFGNNMEHFRHQIEVFRFRFGVCGAIIAVAAAVFICDRMKKPMKLTPDAVEAFKDVQPSAEAKR